MLQKNVRNKINEIVEDSRKLENSYRQTTVEEFGDSVQKYMKKL